MSPREDEMSEPNHQQDAGWAMGPDGKVHRAVQLAPVPGPPAGVPPQTWYARTRSLADIQAAVLEERERCLQAVAALATESRDREERDLIARCWNAIHAQSAGPGS